jgi:hypothetical protein
MAAKASTFARLMSGEAKPRQQRQRKEVEYGPADYSNMNQVPSLGLYTQKSRLGRLHADEWGPLTNFTPHHQKWFASKALFDKWWGDLQRKHDTGQISDRAWAQIERLTVRAREDGTVIVYHEINGVDGYQSDGDRLVAINGYTYRPTNATTRKNAMDKGLSMGDYRRGTTGWNSTKPLNVNAIISKFVAAGAALAGLSGQGVEGWGVKEFARAASSYYKPIKKHVLAVMVAALEQALRRPLATRPADGEVHSEKDRVEKKFVGDEEFRALALASLTGCSFEAGALMAAVEGREQQCANVASMLAAATSQPEQFMVSRVLPALTQMGYIEADVLRAIVLGGPRPERPKRARGGAAPMMVQPLALPPPMDEVSLALAEGGEDEAAELPPPSTALAPRGRPKFVRNTNDAA